MKPIRKIACWGAHRSGLSLIELMVVLLILVALAGIVLPLTSGVSEEARSTTTTSTMRTVQRVVNRYLLDMQKLPQPKTDDVFSNGSDNNVENRRSWPQLRYLYVAPANTPDYDPVIKLGWNGPYMVDSPGFYVEDGSRRFWPRFGLDDDPTPIDAWGNPIVIVSDPWNPTQGEEVTWYIKSAGPDGIIEQAIDGGDDMSLEVYYQDNYQPPPGP